MKNQIDVYKTLEIIERLQFAKIGEHKKWKKIRKKLKSDTPLQPQDLEYFSNLTRIYKNSTISTSRFYHKKLSQIDEKPPCKMCGENSEFYCNMNDQYYCLLHVVGHDENEF